MAQTQTIDDLLTLAEDEVRNAQKDADEAQKRLDRALTDRDSLKSLVTRLVGTPPIASSADDDTNTWTDMTRTDAVLRIVREHRGLSPKEIAAALTKLGRPNDTPELVSSALDKLRRRGLAESVGYGEWVAKEPKDRVIGVLHRGAGQLEIR